MSKLQDKAKELSQKLSTTPGRLVATVNKNDVIKGLKGFEIGLSGQETWFVGLEIVPDDPAPVSEKKWRLVIRKVS